MKPHPFIYQIYVDAFARGSSGRSRGRRRGGDLEGVIERLDHVASLGADAIWLTPIFASSSDHGYNITDYFRVDPRLATDETPGAAEDLFGALVESAHRRGIAILLDLPLNHCGHGYDLATTHPDRDVRIRAARTRQERGWSRDLKYFDADHEDTRRFLFDVARHWVERFGVDGYRYDYVHGIANPFWEALYAELRAIRSDLFVVGEHWDDMGGPEANAADIASRFDGDEGPCFDTLFDFPFQAAAVESIAAGEPSGLVQILDFCDGVYPRPTCAMLDNHDTARVADWAGRDARRTAMALKLLAAQTGPMSVLYGTETGLAAGKLPKRAVDESSRVPMNWDSPDEELLETSRRVFALRRSVFALCAGRVERRAAIGPLYIEVKLAASGERVGVVLNFGDDEVPAGTEVGGVLGQELQSEDMTGGSPLDVRDGRLRVPVPSLGGGYFAL